MTEEGPNEAAQSVATASNVNRPWLLRIVIITACLLGYATWSLYDAYIAYPERGSAYASWAEWDYLQKVSAANSKESPGIMRREAAVLDPAEEFARLRSDEVRQRNESDLQGGSRQMRAAMELARQNWLNALSLIDRLDPAYTNFFRNPDPVVTQQFLDAEETGDAETVSGLRATLDPATPNQRLTDLGLRWTTESPPGALRSYDIPVNKIQAVICLFFSVYLISLFLRVLTKTYRWDIESKTLTLPSGESITPEDLEDVDKRKWDKFIVFLRIKPSHDKLGGKEIRFDTYRHGHVESWILEMEKVAFPDRVENSDVTAEEPAEDATSPEQTDEQPSVG